MAKRQPFTFENNVAKVIEKVEAAPYRVMNTIGQTLVKEIRPKVKRRRGSGRLRKSLGYWARKRDKDLQIGFKIFYAPFVYKHNDPIKPVVVRNIGRIQDMIRVALDEIRKV